MSGTRALVLLVVAAGMLALAAMDGVIAQILVAVGLPSGAAERLDPILATSFAAGGFVLIVVALFRTFRHDARQALVGPYAEALKPFAAEFGRGVVEAGQGVQVHLVRDGQVVEIVLTLTQPGRIDLRSAVPARQSLAWCRADDPPPVVAARWRDVERRPTWRMCAELPAMARPLLTDMQLSTAVDRVFGAPWTHSVSHVLTGISVEAELPPLEDLVPYLRACADLTFRLRRVNG